MDQLCFLLNVIFEDIHNKLSFYFVSRHQIEQLKRGQVQFLVLNQDHYVIQYFTL
jgi:fructose-1,6-bisphosphatase